MNKRRPGENRRPKRSGPQRRPNTGTGARRPASRPHSTTASGRSGFDIIERRSNPIAGTPIDVPAPPPPLGPFRVLIAVHRPRFRGRAERAAALIGWEVTSLLNRQDPVGQVNKASGPPDLVILSGDFGRQKDYGIFRAIQAGRAKGMRLIGMVEDCETAPEGFPDSAPNRLCDICLTPPFKTTDLRALFSQLYEQIRGKPAPPPRSSTDVKEDTDDDL